jgi:hypothetical protein
MSTARARLAAMEERMSDLQAVHENMRCQLDALLAICAAAGADVREAEPVRPPLTLIPGGAA